MIDWKALPSFLAVARHGSLRAAAEQLDATHATVRRQVEGLETQLGTQLFRRRPGGLDLTAAGRQLLPDALDAEAALLKGFNRVHGLDREASGRIRLSADPMTGHYLLAPIIAEFCLLYPEIEFEMRLSYDLDSITQSETDMSVRHVLELEENVVGRKLFPMVLGVYAARSYIDTHLPSAGAQGQGLTWIGYGPVPELDRMVAQSAFPRAQVRHAVPDPEMHLHLVRAGMGMSFLSHWVEARFPEVQRVPGTAVDTRRSTWIVYHEDLRHVRRVRLFVDFLAARFQERRTDFIGV
jgi:DNA-binding transcriptional LysR family regulator